MRPNKYVREDILLAIESLKYKLNEKPTYVQVAEFLNTSPQAARYYVTKFNLRDLIKKEQGGQQKGEKHELRKADIINELQQMKEVVKMMNEKIDKYFSEKALII